MNYENAYKETLERAKKMYNEDCHICQSCLEQLFSELTENKDERIRKLLLDYHRNTTNINGISGKDIIAWIEKQGEQKPLSPQEAMDIAVEKCFEEQKLADKVEPKFKVGDWLTNGACVIQITSIDDKYYWRDNDCVGEDIESTDKEYHLWTIQDAKDGDVLCCESGWTCIFKTLNSDNISFSSYCFMDNTGWFCETGSESHTLEKAFIKAYNGNIYPATKEQRDLLFQKMKEAGYMWDSEKKELKKVVTEMKTPEESLGIDSDTYNKIVDECIYGDNEQKSDSYSKEHCKGFQETGKCFADGECKAKREAEQKTQHYIPMEAIEKAAARYDGSMDCVGCFIGGARWMEKQLKDK